MGKKSKSKNKKSKYNVAEAYFLSQCPCVLNNSCPSSQQEYASAEAVIAAAGYRPSFVSGTTSASSGYRPSIAPTSLLGVTAFPVV